MSLLAADDTSNIIRERGKERHLRARRVRLFVYPSVRFSIYLPSSSTSLNVDAGSPRDLFALLSIASHSSVYYDIYLLPYSIVSASISYRYRTKMLTHSDLKLCLFNNGNREGTA